MGMVLATGCPSTDTSWRLLRPSPLQQGGIGSACSKQQCILICQQVLHAGQLTKCPSQEQSMHYS